MTEQQKETMKELREQGFGYKLISKTLCIPLGSVKSFFNRLIKTKNNGVCRNCGVTICHTKGHRKKIFCSEKCRYKWRKDNPEKRNLKAYYFNSCQWCGLEFRAYGDSKRKYCSRVCYLAAHTKGAENSE